MSNSLKIRDGRRFLFPVALGIAAALLAPRAEAQSLYDGSLGTTPGSQGYLALANVNVSAPATTAVETYSAANGGSTTLDSSASNAIYSGYSNYNLTGSMVNATFPTLNAAQGFTLNFTVQVTEENIVPTAASSNPRAGLSVILLDSQHQGIEIGFDTNSIFSQSADFSSASEFTNSTLPDALNSYALTIAGPSYSLVNNGITLLTGSIKQYSGSGQLANLVYNESNLVFLGDDTTSDGGSFNIHSASINASASAPEPGTLAFMALGVCAAAAVRLRGQSVG